MVIINFIAFKSLIYFSILIYQILELNSPKNIVIKTASKPQDPDFKPLVLNLPSRPGNGVSAIDCKEYMISLEKELRNVLKSKSSKTRMRNMGMIF